MWLCSNHPIGVHHFGNEDSEVFTVTIPLDGFAACSCDAFGENVKKLGSKASERQATCRHIAQAMTGKCSFRHESPLARCALCGKPMKRVEDVVPGWVGRDRAALLKDLLTIRKELHDETTG